MLAVAVAPTITHKPKGYRPNRFTWNKEQAAQARAKSLETRRRKAIERKAIAAKAKAMVNEVCSEDPIASVEKALSLATKHGKAKAVESLASALAKLKRAGVGREPGPGQPACVSYTPTHSSSPRSSHASTPQSAQHVQYQPSTVQHDFAQYRDHLVKESPFSGPVPTGYPGQGAPGSGVGGVIETITRSPLPVESGQVQAEITALEARLAKLKAQVKSGSVVSSVPPVSGSGVGVDPVKGVQEQERFCVNGHWILGKRVK